MNGPIDPEGEGGEGSERLVGAGVGEGHAPEVRGEERRGVAPNHARVGQNSLPKHEKFG